MEIIKSNLTCVKFTGGEDYVRYKLTNSGELIPGENTEYSKRDPESTEMIYSVVPQYLENPDNVRMPAMLHSVYEGDIYAIIYSWFYIWDESCSSRSVLECRESYVKIYNVLKRTKGKWADVTKKFKKEIKECEKRCHEK